MKTYNAVLKEIGGNKKLASKIYLLKGWSGKPDTFSTLIRKIAISPTFEEKTYLVPRAFAKAVTCSQCEKLCGVMDQNLRNEYPEIWPDLISKRIRLAKDRGQIIRLLERLPADSCHRDGLADRLLSVLATKAERRQDYSRLDIANSSKRKKQIINEIDQGEKTPDDYKFLIKVFGNNPRKLQKVLMGYLNVATTTDMCLSICRQLTTNKDKQKALKKAYQKAQSYENFERIHSYITELYINHISGIVYPGLLELVEKNMNEKITLEDWIHEFGFISPVDVRYHDRFVKSRFDKIDVLANPENFVSVWHSNHIAMEHKRMIFIIVFSKATLQEKAILYKQLDNRMQGNGIGELILENILTTYNE